jgi:hypothetical protein
LELGNLSEVAGKPIDMPKALSGSTQIEGKTFVSTQLCTSEEFLVEGPFWVQPRALAISVEELFSRYPRSGPDLHLLSWGGSARSFPRENGLSEKTENLT